MAKQSKRYKDGEVPDAGPKQERADRRPFLKVSDIPSSGATVTFNGKSRVVAGKKFGDQWMCDVRIGSKEYTWGIRIGGSVHQSLQEITGRKLKAGLKVNVEVREFENSAGEEIKFIAIVED